jgi:predicted transcriptional regulator
MTTLNMTRAEKADLAARLRSEGLLGREIAAYLGVARSTVDSWLNDPDGSRLRARQDSYRGRCVECGGPTDGHDGPARAPSLCMACREWSAEDCIEAIRSWATEHGGIPPTCTEWRATGDGQHPCAHTVAQRCGGWNEALLRAGYALHMDRSPETQAWVIEEIRAGVPVGDIARVLGVSAAAVYHRINGRGLSVRDLRAAA